MATASREGRRDPRHALGAAAEDAAAAALVGAGLQILLRNWRRRTGELDIIAREGEVLVVVEVRVRSRADYGSAADSIDPRKCRRIIRTTQQLLQQQPALGRLRLRFDVIAARPLDTDRGAARCAPLQSALKILPDPGGRFELAWIRHAFAAEP